ncbi:hypothetical protein D9611_008610 [Ephemerocybe angulata]|uniref:Uncharacterized protein n=1 Tax=Ephemerocybe angulata TaxID=980116 RepID=A0A8H5EVF4_9AGAR|nr:hypothetical protein D9611_008610 [Tulosesus angulatus]
MSWARSRGSKLNSRNSAGQLLSFTHHLPFPHFPPAHLNFQLQGAHRIVGTWKLGNDLRILSGGY